jgi:hypothetical protein
VLVGRLEIVSVGNIRSVPQPLRHHMDGEPLRDSFWEILRIWLRSCSSKPGTIVEAVETPAATAKNASSEPTKEGPMETTFENLVEFFEADGLKHEAHPESGVVIAETRAA